MLRFWGFCASGRPLGLWAIAGALDGLRYDSGWFGGLDLSRDCEDPRTPFSGDKFSAVREVAKTDGGFSFRAPLGTESELESPRSRAQGGERGVTHWLVELRMHII
jgi:hypothetical protein